MKRLIYILIATGLFLYALIAVFNKASFPILDIGKQGAEFSIWHDRLNVIYNSFYQWRGSYILNYISQFLTGYLRNQAYASFIISFTLIFSGALAYFSRNLSIPRFSHLVLAAAIPAFILLVVGCDSMVIQSFAGSFWLLYCSRLFLESQRLLSFGFIGYLLSACLLYETANQIAFLIAALVLSISVFTVSNTDWRKRALLIFTVFTFMLVTVYSPVPKIPDYPAAAHVVPDDNLPGNIIPLIGPSPHIPIINRQQMKNFHFLPVAVLFIGSLIAWSAYRKKWPLANLLLFLSVCCMLDSFFSETVSVISPLYVITKLVPGLFYVPILPIGIAASICVFAAVSADAGRHVFASAAFLFFLSLFGTRIKINPSLLSSPLEILASPSFNVLSESGEGILRRKDKNYTYNKLSFEDFESIQASDNSDPEQLKHMFDGREKSRWSPQKSGQEGNEWLIFNFKTSQMLQGIYLSCGNFTADFPRGIEVEGSVDCQSYFNIYFSPTWQGNIAFTEDGYPFYANQADVKIYFDKTVDFKCLRVKQIGSSSHFDWSIAEFETIS